MYVKMKKPTSMFLPSVKPLCVAYHGVCLNRGVEGLIGSATHCDVKKDSSIFNAVIPCGDFKGEELVLWGLKIIVELCPGDVFLFYGSLIAHNITGIKGDRNSVNLFRHYCTYKWATRVKTGETGSGYRVEKVPYGQDWTDTRLFKK
jgi:hypothetical protein